MNDAQHLDELIEIVDALTCALADHLMVDLDTRRTLKNISDRANALYRKRIEDEIETYGIERSVDGY